MPAGAIAPEVPAVFRLRPSGTGCCTAEALVMDDEELCHPPVPVVEEPTPTTPTVGHGCRHGPKPVVVVADDDEPPAPVVLVVPVVEEPTPTPTVGHGVLSHPKPVVVVGVADDDEPPAPVVPVLTVVPQAAKPTTTAVLAPTDKSFRV